MLAIFREKLVQDFLFGTCARYDILAKYNEEIFSGSSLKLMDDKSKKECLRKSS